MTPGEEPAVRCPNCAAQVAPGAHYCRRCGAPVAPAPPAPPPAPATPPPVPPPAPAATGSEQRYRLDTPPANERWWRNPVVVIGVVVTLLTGGGGVATWRILATSATTALHVSPPAVPAGAAGAAAQAAGQAQAAAQRAVTAIDAVLKRSQAGRTAALQQRDYAAALRNRQSLIAALRSAETGSLPAGLARASAMLLAALQASAHTDEQHLRCGCDALQPADVEAQRLKQRFAQLFDPYARRYLGGPVDPDQI